MSTDDVSQTPQPEGAKLHLGIAEQGKLYALEGDHGAALFYYRKAMQMSVEVGDPEVFFRHYLDCVMETLEHLGSYPEIVEFCDKALELYAENPPQDPLTLRDQAHIYQKLGVVQLKSGDGEAARRSFAEALAVLVDTDQQLPLAASLLRWLEMGMHLDSRRILAEQERNQYFTVRRETVDPERAVKLPDEMVQREIHAGAVTRGVHHGG